MSNEPEYGRLVISAETKQALKIRAAELGMSIKELAEQAISIGLAKMEKKHANNKQ